MSLASLKQSATELSEKDLRELVLYLQYVCDNRHIDLGKEFAAVIDDRSPDRWTDWSVVREEMKTAP